MTLRFNAHLGEYVLYSDDEAAARACGLTLSKTARGPNGEKAWYPAAHDDGRTAVDNPYAVLRFYREADPAARARLKPYWEDYRASWATDCDQDYPAPDGKSFLPYQRAGIAYCLRKGSAIIGDEPGLGKTIQAIGLANALGMRRVLVICPATIRLNWRREILAWSSKPGVVPQVIGTGRDHLNPRADFVVTSYDLTRKPATHEALCKLHWDMIVADEGHYLKSMEAQRTRALFGGGQLGSRFRNRYLAQSADRIVTLTGTPLPNRPRESYMLARGCNWEAIDWLGKDAFEYRFNPSARYGDHTVEKTGRIPELQARLRCNLMVRRHKSTVLKDLPDKRYELSYLAENGAIRDVLARERLLDFDPAQLFASDYRIDGQVSTVRREMGEAKVPRVIEHLRYLLDIVELPKVVVFSHHRSVMDALHEALHRYGLVAIRGGMTTLRKQAAVDAFVGDPDVRVISCQLDAAGFGVDGLQQVCDHVVFAEPGWWPGVNEQAVDRLHRIGQHQNVVAQFLIVEGSLDERVLKAVLIKAKDIHETLDRPLDDSPAALAARPAEGRVARGP